MSAEFYDLYILAKEMEKRARLCGLTELAEKAARLALETDPTAQLIRDHQGPERFIPPAVLSNEVVCEPTSFPFFNFTNFDNGLSVSQLVEREHNELVNFFGCEVPVVQPPSSFVKILQVAPEFTDKFQPLYFPKWKFEKFAKIPGWKARPHEWLWEQISQGNIDPNATSLGGYWAFFDASQRPDFNKGEGMFKNDPLDQILRFGRKCGNIDISDDLSHLDPGSRFGTIPPEQDNYIFPMLKHIVESQFTISQFFVGRPTEMEFNFAGNLRFPHLGGGNSWEWLNNRFQRGSWYIDKFPTDYWLVSGNRKYNGLSSIDCFPTQKVMFNKRIDEIAFRPIFRFFSEND